ncbi:MAG: hypothetical protein E6K81_11415 [Candidatus Eisenbacteria bacterium]|uniref:Uncharacterized protein n=1 Tax=Eiseniibacteriota bacterium TaxID=2212470 RepID=A0A538U4T4_UNCEI|nr:MAG: hypothetical protein E6K81_11415 [Candidatus Eisenbacteria bacterium]
MFLKRVFYASVSVLMLALAFHFGAVSAGAQAPGNPIAAAFMGINNSYMLAITSNGDVYRGGNPQGDVWTYSGNIFSSGPVPTAHETLGGLKVKYR